MQKNQAADPGGRSIRSRQKRAGDSDPDPSPDQRAALEKEIKIRQLTDVVEYDNIILMSRDTRSISWVKAAQKDFQKFPKGAQTEILRALTIAAEGRKADIAKPMKGLGSGIFEVALAWRGNAYRTVYAVLIDEAIWIVHAFQKRSKTGIKTPKAEIDLIRHRLKRLKEMLK